MKTSSYKGNRNTVRLFFLSLPSFSSPVIFSFFLCLLFPRSLNPSKSEGNKFYVFPRPPTHVFFLTIVAINSCWSYNMYVYTRVTTIFLCDFQLFLLQLSRKLDVGVLLHLNFTQLKRKANFKLVPFRSQHRCGTNTKRDQWS